MNVAQIVAFKVSNKGLKLTLEIVTAQPQPQPQPQPQHN